MVTEDPGLHLLWYEDKVYIKPLPQYLTKHDFWRRYLSGDTPASLDLRKAALGFIRSYCFLIRHASDMHIASEKHLVATSDFEKLLHFLRFFRSITDDRVTPRYAYGELRLSRLNLYCKFYRFQVFYRKVNWRYGSYLTKIIVGPFVFVFAVLSVVLSAMQVILAAEQNSGDHTASWVKFVSVSRWFSVVCLFLAAGCFVSIPILVAFFLLREFLYAVRSARRPRGA